MKLFIFMSLVCTRHILAQNNYPLDYMCHPDATISVHNPRPDVFYSASSYNIANGHACDTIGTTYPNGTVVTFTILGCPKDEQIGFTMSTRSSNDSMGDGVIGGAVETYIIQCVEFAQEGVMFQSNLFLTVAEPDPADSDYAVSSLPSVDVTFSITSSIWNEAYSSKVNTAEIGTLLKWHIKGPTEYDVLPVSCIAYGGISVGGSSSKILTANGCTVDSSLTSDFSSSYGPDSTERSEIQTNLHAFKFINHDYITLACTVRACVKGPNTSCQQNCTTTRRKRRSSLFSRADLQRFSNLIKQTDGKQPLEQETSTLPTIANRKGKERPQTRSGFIVKQILVTEWASSACNTGGSQTLLFLCAVLSSVLTSRTIAYLNR